MIKKFNKVTGFLLLLTCIVTLSIYLCMAYSVYKLQEVKEKINQLDRSTTELDEAVQGLKEITLPE